MANVARRWIEFFEETNLTDPDTGKPLTGDNGEVVMLTNREFISKIMGNPLWAEGYAQGKAQDNVMTAFEKAKEANEGGYWVSEDDWKFLKKAAEEPRFLLFKNGMGVVQPGFGYHPSMTRQFVRAQTTIVEAKTEADKLKFDAELAKMRAQPLPAQASA